MIWNARLLLLLLLLLLHDDYERYRAGQTRETRSSDASTGAA
jgi:hypothetical protein